MAYTEITSKPPPIGQKLIELWQQRELISLLAWRDLRVRYAQTIIGITWALFNPLINLLLLSFVFNQIAGLTTEGIPPLLYGAAGLIGWTFFAESMNKAGESFLANQEMVRKIYFPRLALPISAVLSSLPDLLISLFLFIALMIFYGFFMISNLWGLLILFPVLLLAASSAGIWVSALTIRFRDFRFITPVILRIGLFAVPITYSARSIPEGAVTLIYFLNPLAGIVEGFKWALLGSSLPPVQALYGIILLLLFFLSGLYFFYQVESKVADLL